MKIDTTSGIVETGEKIEEAIGEIAKQGYGDLLRPFVKALGTTLMEGWNGLFGYRVHYWSEAQKIQFLKRFVDYCEQVEAISEEHRSQIPVEIGIPVMDRLSYVQDDDIAGKFVRLLVTASSDETINLAHPSFIHVIDNISSDEAKILDGMDRSTELMVITGRSKSRSAEVKTGTGLVGTDANLLFHENVQLYLDNLTGLGVLRSNSISGTGRAVITEYGKMFLKACRKVSQNASESQ